MSPRWTCARGVLAAVVWALPLGAGASAAPRFAPLSAWDIAALERARAGAVHRLAQAECQRVLSDFMDARTFLIALRVVLSKSEPTAVALAPPAMKKKVHTASRIF